MMFTLSKSKALCVVFIAIGFFILGSNTYNCVVTTGLIDVELVLKQSFTSLTTIAGGVTTYMAHTRNTDGTKLPNTKEEL